MANATNLVKLSLTTPRAALFTSFQFFIWIHFRKCPGQLPLIETILNLHHPMHTILKSFPLLFYAQLSIISQMLQTTDLLTQDFSMYNV